MIKEFDRHRVSNVIRSFISLRLKNPLRWKIEVCGAGLAVIDGYLVSSIEGKEAGGWIFVRAAKPAGAYGLKLARAVAEPRPDGSLKLTWADESRPKG